MEIKIKKEIKIYQKNKEEELKKKASSDNNLPTEVKNNKLKINQDKRVNNNIYHQRPNYQFIKEKTLNTKTKNVLNTNIFQNKRNDSKPDVLNRKIVNNFQKSKQTFIRIIILIN